MSIAALLEALPGQCSLCRGWGRGALCDACRRDFVTPRARCTRCAIAVVPGQPVCGACLREPPPFERAVAALDYAPPWDALILRFKFRGQAELAGLFAGLMRDALCNGPACDAVVPAPLSEARMRERGFNQSWELARRLAPTADARLLLRVRDTPHQLELPPQRRAANVRSAFAVEPLRARDVQGRRIAIVDDVLTTGATAAEMARTLLAAGAAGVHLWVLARTPAPASA